MNENAMNYYRQREWQDIVAQLEQNLYFDRVVDADGQLRQTDRMLNQKRGCRR